MALDDGYSKSLIHFNGANGSTTFTDESGKIWTAYGAAQLSTDVAGFYAATGKFDGVGAYIRTPYHTDFNLAAGDWTEEFSFIAPNFAAAYGMIGKDKYGVNQDLALVITNNTTISINTNDNNSHYNVTVPAMTVLAKHHLALVVRAGTTHLFLDGIEYGAGSVLPWTNNSNDYITIGCLSWNNPQAFFPGYIWERRFSAFARYTTDFTPPTGPFGITIPTQVHKGSLHNKIVHPLLATVPAVTLENQTFSHLVGDFLKSGNVTESGPTLLSDASMNFGIDARNAQTTCRYNWFTNLGKSNDLSAFTPIMTLSEAGKLSPILLSAPVEVYGGNESNIATNATGGILNLLYRGATDAITQVNLCDGKAAGVLAGLNTAILNAYSSSIPIVGERSTSLTNTIRSALTARAKSSGDMVDGFGAGILFAIEDTALTENPIAGVYGIRNGADNTGAIQFIVYSAGTGNSVMTLDQNGIITAGGLGLTGSFGCNGASRQTAYARTGSLAATATSGGYGFVSAAEFNDFVSRVTSHDTALANNGVLS